MGVELEGCGSCVRWLFIICNIPILLLGLASLGIGIWQLIVDSALEEVLSEDYTSGGALFVACGVFLIALSIIGALGALLKWRILLLVYLAVIFVVIVLEIAAAAYAFAKADDIDEDVIVQDLRSALDRYYPLNDTTGNLDTDLNDVVDFIQEGLECCGISNFSDWDTSPFFTSLSTYPGSCCDREESETCSSSEVFTEGCRGAFTDFVEQNLYILAGVGIGFAVFEVLLVVMSFYLFLAINNALVLTKG